MPKKVGEHAKGLPFSKGPGTPIHRRANLLDRVAPMPSRHVHPRRILLASDRDDRTHQIHADAHLLTVKGRVHPGPAQRTGYDPFDLTESVSITRPGMFL